MTLKLKNTNLIKIESNKLPFGKRDFNILLLKGILKKLNLYVYLVHK